MADNRSVTITLKTDKSGSQDEQTNTAKQTSFSTESQQNDSNSSAKATAAYMAIQVISTTSSELVAWGEYYWNRYLVLNDDYIGQREKQIATTQVNRVISGVSTIGSWAATGAQISGGNPIVTAIFAALGVAQVGVGIVRSNMQGQEQQDIMITQMDRQLNFTRSRVGWSTNAASIGEDL